MQANPQKTWIYTVNTENNIKNGPGQRDPIPHPNPKHNAPTINFQSTPEALIGTTFYPNNVVFLN
jgi:hypothetical protein